MSTQKFYQLYTNGLVALDDIYDYMDKWHNEISPEELHDYLGMTEQQFNKWFEDGSL